MVIENPAILLDKVKEVMCQVQAKVREKERSIESLINSVGSTHSKVLLMLNDQIDHLELEKIRLQDELNIQLVANDDCVERLGIAEEKSQASSSKVEHLEREKEGLLGQIENNRVENKELHKQNSEIEIKLDDQQKTITKLEHEKSALAEENDRQKKKLQGELHQASTEISQLNTRVADLQAELQRVKSEASDQIRQLAAENKELSSGLEKALRDKRIAEARAQKIQESWDQLES
ncbi:MAG: hypothetical protein OEV89_07390 [Desulfobulbaceae bacterium]|nr:hypothetical protein [Desulfobulbaceae bacterium]HIJ90576.1 hypothetical protein [Deltaproteobacteria bacterium]